MPLDRGPDAEKLLFRIWISSMDGPIVGNSWATKEQLDKALWEGDSVYIELPGCVDDLDQPVVCQIRRSELVAFVCSTLTKRMVQPVQAPSLVKL